MHRVAKEHEPVGCLPFVLAGLTGAIVAAVTARSIRWYFMVVMAIVGTLGMLIGLTFFRLAGWRRQHPLLARMFALQHLEKRDDPEDDDLLELSMAIVRKYLPEAESKTILDRLDDATARTAALLWFDGDGEPLVDHEGA